MQGINIWISAEWNSRFSLQALAAEELQCVFGDKGGKVIGPLNTALLLDRHISPLVGAAAARCATF